jgi:hypothetical protein
MKTIIVTLRIAESSEARSEQALGNFIAAIVYWWTRPMDPSVFSYIFTLFAFALGGYLEDIHSQ